MQARAYVMSTLAGSAVVFVWQVVSGLLGMYFLRQTLGPMTNAPGEVAPYNIGGLLTGSMLFSCLGILVMGLAYLGSGALYAYLHTRRETITTEQSMLGGAASAASVSLVRALAGALVAFLTRPMFLRLMNEGVPGKVAPFPGGNMMAFSVASGFIGACTGIVIAVALGLAGGILGRALFGE